MLRYPRAAGNGMCKNTTRIDARRIKLHKYEVAKDFVPVFPELIQQGVAKLFGDYTLISGGHEELAARILTNYAVNTYKDIGLSPEEFNYKLHNRDHVITIGVSLDEDDPSSGHAYCVKKVFKTESGDAYLQLFEPNNSNRKPGDKFLLNTEPTGKRGIVNIKYDDIKNRADVSVAVCYMLEQLKKSVKKDFPTYKEGGYFTIKCNRSSPIFE